LYFLEFLETCTIGWVSFCEGGVGVGKESAFFILVGGDGTHRPHPGFWPYSPQVETPAPAHPERTTHAGQIMAVRDALGCEVCPIGQAQTDKIIVNKNIYFLCINHLTKEIKLFTI
jgi:hypothetical protein